MQSKCNVVKSREIAAFHISYGFLIKNIDSEEAEDMLNASALLILEYEF